jgi:iron complex transport system substrate-binding protein
MVTLTRRSFTLLGLAAGTSLITGCSSGAQPGASGDPAAAGSAATAAFPVSFEHAFGSTEVTAEPKRVVALGVNDGDALLALGVVPVGNAGYTFYPNGFGPWAEPYLKGAELTRIESDSEPDFEQIAALTPDLIIALNSGIDEQAYAKLSQLAPTVARPADSGAYGVQTDVQMKLVGKAIGRADAAEAELSEYEKLIKDTVEAHPEFAGKTGVVILPYDGQYGAYLPRDSRGAFLDNLGIALPQAIDDLDDGSAFFVPISAEQVPLLDGDLILVIGAEDRSAFTDSSSLFGNLKSKIIFGDTDQRGAISYNSVLSIPYAIDSFVPRIADALASDS